MKKLFVIISVVALVYLVSPLTVCAENLYLSNTYSSLEICNEGIDASVIVNGDGNVVYYNTVSSDSEEPVQTEENETSSKPPNITFTIPIPPISIFRRRKHKHGKTKH